MNIWQIGAGVPGRDYRQVFFEYDLMLIGPGDPGDAYQFNYNQGASQSIYRQIHRFTHSPQPGDRVLMRMAHEVIGVGQIPAGDEHQYSHDSTFQCVYGWNLQHCRRVLWADKLELGPLAQVFKDDKQKPTFTRIHENHIVELASKIDHIAFRRPLKSFPNIDTGVYQDEELGVALFQAGISNRNIDEILKALQQAARLCAWYQSGDQKPRPSEHEIISHVTLPVFLGLGWSHQQIAIEWDRIDMAFFKATPTNAENCVMVLEAKGLGQALSDVLHQPKEYVHKLGLSNARYILVTDGANLFVYERNEMEWNPTPIGYINYLYLQKQYIIPKETDLVKTLVSLQPGLI